MCVTNRKKNTPPISSIDDISLVRKYNLDIPDEIEVEDQIIAFLPDLSEISENVVAYIAGFVVKKIKKIIFCNECQIILEESRASLDDTYFNLLKQKNRGGLLRPSSDVIKICMVVEKKIRLLMSINSNKIPKESNFLEVFVSEVASSILHNKKMFQQIDDHIFDHGLMENPRCKIIKYIISIYAKIRIYSFAKKQTEAIKGELVRKKLSKIILFSGQ